MLHPKISSSQIFANYIACILNICDAVLFELVHQVLLNIVFQGRRSRTKEISSQGLYHQQIFEEGLLF